MRRTAVNEATLQQRIIYNESDNILYDMRAEPGTTYDQARWRIKKLFYDESGNYIGSAWANGSDVFDKVADDYASYTYTPDPSE